MTKETYKRKISAIFSSDVVGYSRLMGEDEETTVRTLVSYRNTIIAIIQAHNGRVVDSPGDNILAEFASVVNAVQGAVEIQKAIKAENAELPENRKMEFRIGINLGDVIEDGDQLYGDGVNIAARIEGLADPGGICISGSAYEQIVSKLALGYEDLGEHAVKNILRPVQVYRIPMGEGIAGKAIKRKKGRLKPLKWMTVALVAAFIITGIVVSQDFFLKSFHPPKGTVLREKPAIAVLPFDNMSGDPDQEYFSDGITEEIISRLSMNKALLVISRNSTFLYKNKPVNIRQVGEELNTQYILEGSVRRSENRIRITAQLIEATSEAHIWSKSYDRELADIFAIQDDISQQITAAIRGEILEAEVVRVKSIPTENLTAWDACIRAYGSIGSTKEDIERIRTFGKKAIASDPEFACGYRILAMSYTAEYSLTLEPETLEKAFNLANKALILDPTADMNYFVLAGVYDAKQQYDQALVQIETAISINPNNDWYYWIKGDVLVNMGKPEEAAKNLEQAIRLNPANNAWKGVYLGPLSKAYNAMKQYDKAIETAQEAIAINPNSIVPYFQLNGAYRALGRKVEAVDSLKKALSVNPDMVHGYVGLFFTYYIFGQYDEVKTEADIIRERFPDFSSKDWVYQSEIPEAQKKAP